MEDNSRYEDVPEKKSVGAKIGGYFKNVFGGFIDSFRYNNMKLAAILVAIPGLIIGFFLVFHALTINQMAFTYSENVEIGRQGRTIIYEQISVGFSGMSFDGTGIAIFLLMLFGILNVFTSLNMSGKKNKGSVILATVFTALLVIITVYYVYAVFYYKKITSEGELINTTVQLKSGADYEFNKHVILQNDKIDTFNSNYMASVVSIIICDVLSVIGVVLGFINYDRTYEKVDR
jgi:hypothetical protein